MTKILVFILSVFVLGLVMYNHRDTRLPNGIVFSEDAPVQVNIPKKDWVKFSHYAYSDLKISKIAKYDITGKILAKELHKGNLNSERISPITFAMGWDKMSDEFYASHDLIKFWVSNRTFRYRYKEGYPLDPQYIDINTSNNHIIFANDMVKEQVYKIKIGDVVNFKGYLARVGVADGGFWESSLSRTDRGVGACELIYVEEVNVIAN